VHQDGTVTLYAVLPFDANDGGYAASVLTSNVSAALPYAPVEAHGSMGVKVHVQEGSVIHSLDTLASMSAVAAVEPRLQLTYHNAPEARIVQSDKASPSTGLDAAPFWEAGINGTGQLVQVGDSGLDVKHCMFRDDGHDVGPGHRKVHAYVKEYEASDAALGDHGTHVTGSILGSNSSADAYETEDGVAFGARVHFTGLGDGKNLTLPQPNNYDGYFKRAYDAGARLSSNSWGSSLTSDYQLSTFYLDNILRNRNDSTILFCAQNFGRAFDLAEVSEGVETVESFGSISDEASAKNVLTVGATMSPNAPASALQRKTPLLNESEPAVEPFGYELKIDDGNIPGSIAALNVGNANISTSDQRPVFNLSSCKEIETGSTAKNAFVFAQISAISGCLPQIEKVETDAVYFIPGFQCGPLIKNGSSELELLKKELQLASVSLTNWEFVSKLSALNSSLQARLDVMEIDEEEIWKSTVTTFSSKGPTSDGRVKPDVVAPGAAIKSAKVNTSCGVLEDTGTSMATPLTAGAMALMREYMQKRVTSSPSGPLLKAALINGAQTMVRLHLDSCNVSSF
jgi:subtilisin family serine protease